MSQTTPTDAEATKYAEVFILHGDKTKAFRQAFPNSKATGNGLCVTANKFHKYPKVSLRVEELQDIIQEGAKTEALYAIEDALNDLTEIYTLASTPDMNGKVQASAAVQAIMGKAKIAGLIIDKGEVKATVAKAPKLSEEEAKAVNAALEEDC